MLFDNQGISKYLNTLFLLSPHFCIIDFICDLSVARNDSWMSQKTATRTQQIYAFARYGGSGLAEDWGPVRLA